MVQNITFILVYRAEKLAHKVINKKALVINWHTMLKRLPTPALHFKILTCTGKGDYVFNILGSIFFLSTEH